MKKIIISCVLLCIVLSILVVISTMSVSGAAKPDLKITAASITSNTGSKITYSYTIQNVGEATINNLYNVSIQNFYSKDKVFNDDDDKAAGGKILGVNKSLKPGETYKGTFYTLVKKPSDMNYLTFKIDWGSIIDESNENNNTRALSLLPDLKFVSAKITSKTSTKITYSYTIKNVGGATIDNLYKVSIQNFYSKDKVFNDDDDKAAGGSILAVNKALNPGQTYTGTFYTLVKKPSDMNYLTFKIDWGEIITEGNENNNTYALYLN